MKLLIFLSLVTLCYGIALEGSNVFEDGNSSIGRTFGIGGRRRMQMIFLPIMFKLGVIMTLLVGLTVLVFKTLTIGVILLVIAFSGLFSKVKAGGGYHHHADPVQVHLHGIPGSHHHYPDHISDWNRNWNYLNNYRA